MFWADLCQLLGIWKYQGTIRATETAAAAAGRWSIRFGNFSASCLSLRLSQHGCLCLVPAQRTVMFSSLSLLAPEQGWQHLQHGLHTAQTYHSASAPVSAPEGKSRTGAGLNHHNLLVSWRQRWSKKVWIISVLCRHRNTTAEGAEASPALLQRCHQATLYELTSSLILYWNQRKLLWLVTDVHLIFYYATLTMDFNCRNISTLPPSPPPPSSWFIFHCVVLYHDKNEHWQALSLLTLMYTLHLQCEMWARFGHWAVTDLQLITSVHHPDCCQANELILWTPIHSPLPLPISTEAEYLGPSQKLGFLSEVRRGKERTTQRKDLLLHQSWCWS